MIDVGCGTGNITARVADFLFVDKITGLDVSEDMLSYARRQHAMAGSISYFKADICSDVVACDPADVVLSIHCLHWIPEANQAKALANIRSLLKPGGACYLLLFSWSDMLPLQEQLVYHPRWRKYFKSVIEEDERSSSQLEVKKERRRRRSSAPFPTFDPPPPHERIRLWRQRCDELFFTDVHVSLHEVSFDFGDWKSFQGTLCAQS